MIGKWLNGLCDVLVQLKRANALACAINALRLVRGPQQWVAITEWTSIASRSPKRPLNHDTPALPGLFNQGVHATLGCLTRHRHSVGGLKEGGVHVVDLAELERRYAYVSAMLNLLHMGIPADIVTGIQRLFLTFVTTRALMSIMPAIGLSMDQIGKFLLEHGLYDAAITLGNVQVHVLLPVHARSVYLGETHCSLCVPDPISWETGAADGFV